MSEVILYTTNCPKCTVLKSLMDKKDIQYKTVQDINIMIGKGFAHIPMLDVDGVIMGYAESYKWINQQDIK